MCCILIELYNKLRQKTWEKYINISSIYTDSWINMIWQWFHTLHSTSFIVISFSPLLVWSPSIIYSTWFSSKKTVFINKINLTKIKCCPLNNLCAVKSHDFASRYVMKQNEIDDYDTLSVFALRCWCINVTKRNVKTLRKKRNYLCFIELFSLILE